MPEVVSCLLERKGAILLLKRSDKVGTYKGMWGGVTGFIEHGESALETAYKEICEETGIKREYLLFKLSGEPLVFNDIYKNKVYEWKVFPFVFSLNKDIPISLDWEHSSFQWIMPRDIKKFDTVPRLKEIVEKLFF